MLNNVQAVLWLTVVATGFVALGLWGARHHWGDLEDYVVARNSQTATATVLTLMASSLGAWILFAPAQAASWGGIAALLGYALGAMAPRLLMIPLGRRMRELIPQGYNLSQFVLARYGIGMYGLVLLIMLFYLGITMTAEITAIAKLMNLLAPVPLWLTATIVLFATLLYTAYGGLRATIFTDKIQMLLILPLLAVLVFVGWKVTGGIAAMGENLQQRAPALLDPFNPDGVKAGLTFFLAILLTGLFHQGNWQRIYAAQSTRSMQRGFLMAGLGVAPIIFVMGLFGLAFVGLDLGKDSSVAIFEIVLPGMPLAFALILVPLGLALVMSSVDTAISAVTSIVAVDLRRLMPTASASELLRWSRRSVLLLAIPVLLAAAQGYSVLYLFLLADLLCSAAAFPVFFGLFNTRVTGRIAITATLGGLLAGGLLFPSAGAPTTYLLESFVLAAIVPVFLTLLLMWLSPSVAHYDFNSLKSKIQRLTS